MRLIRFLKKKWNKGYHSRFIMLLALVFLLSAFVFTSSLVSGWYDSRRQQELLASLQTETIAPSETAKPTTTRKATEKTATEPVKTETTTSETRENRPTKINFKSLQERNPDTVGWIEIPGTEINYPIVKGDDNDFYLHRDFQSEKSKSGTIFMDYRNDGDFTNRHSILYGHNMRNGSMFAGSMAYKDSVFFDQNDKIYIDTPDGRTIWQIFATYVTTTDFYYIITDFLDDRSFSSFLQTIQSKSSFQSPVSPVVSDHLLTLSTCTYEYDDARFVVHAIKVDD
ncbi:MAG: class B sortase [Eubacteriales bacterium]|nr:class B sortase [Eubacteriales bacterium]